AQRTAPRRANGIIDAKILDEPGVFGIKIGGVLKVEAPARKRRMPHQHTEQRFGEMAFPGFAATVDEENAVRRTSSKQGRECLVHRLAIREQPLKDRRRGEPSGWSCRWAASRGAGFAFNPAANGVEIPGGVETMEALQIERQRSGIDRLKDGDADFARHMGRIVKSLVDNGCLSGRAEAGPGQLLSFIAAEPAGAADAENLFGFARHF